MPHYRILAAIVLFFSLNATTTADAQKTSPRYQGLLWEITGKGITRPSYLYGTMHVPEKLAFNLSDSFFVALRSVDMVSLETDHDIWQDFMLQMRNDDHNIIMYDRDEYSDRNNYADLYGQSFLYEAPDSRVFGAMFEYKPVMTNEFLYRSNEYRQDYEEDTYLDLFIFQAGKKLGKKVIGLETMDGSYESVMRARIPDDVEDENAGREYVNPMLIGESYRKQDLNALDSLNILLSPGKNFRKYMLEVRNVVMANGIDSIAQSGKAMFSAVGAAHLPSDIGVIELLRKKGYTLRPVTFRTDTDKKDMTEIENIRYPVTLSRQWSADSTWSAEAPGKFYDTSEGWVLDQSLAADMSNGAYYSVYRMKNFGVWAGQSPAYISERIDSLIYEKVPGKIQERKRFNLPYPGHEITTKTRRGDIQRYKIYITPLEIIMFITGGNRDYAAGPEGTRFLNSIQLNERLLGGTNKPQVLAPSSGGCSVTFPSSLLINTTEDPKADTYYAASVQNRPSDTAFYFMTRVDYHDLGYIEEDTFELNIILEKLQTPFTKTPPQQKWIANQPYPTQEIRFQSDKDSSWYFAKLVIQGPHYYLLGCRRQKDVRPADFFDSFRIEPVKWAKGWETTTDTTMHFVVSLPKEEKKPLSTMMQNLVKIGKEIQEKQIAAYRKENPDYYDAPQSIGRTFRYPLLGQEVQLQKRPSLLNDYPSLDSLKRSIKEEMTAADNMYIFSEDWTVSGDTLLVGDYIVRDTNSERAIRNKVVISNDWTYLLRANVHNDPKGQELDYVAQVFKSFHPIDSTSAEKITFGAPKLDFMAEIYSVDSVERSEALYKMKEFGLRNLKPEHFNTLTDAVNHPKFGALKFVDRDWIISAIGETKAKESIGFLKNLTVRYPDSARYRVAVIESLARVKSKEAWRTMFGIWSEYPIFLGDADYTIFFQMRDTLELAHKFLPDILRLAKVEDYSDKCILLIYQLYKKKMIKPNEYASLKPQMIRELSHQISSVQYKEEVKKGSENEGNQYNYDNNNQREVNQYFKLLIPFYEKDKEVSSLFDRALKFGDQPLKAKLYGIMLSNKLAVDQQKMKLLADDDKTRFQLMEELAIAKQLPNYKDWFKDSVAVVRSMLYDKSYRNIDSVRFISKHKAIIERQAGAIYFFDVKEKKSKKWKLAYVRIPLDYGIEKEMDGPLTYQPERRNISVLYNLDTEKEKNEYITKTVSEVRFANRQRYRDTNNSYNRYGNYGEY